MTNPAPCLWVPARVLDTIRAEAEAAWPLECCGLLIGRRDGAVWDVDHAVPTANTAPPADAPDAAGHGRHDRFEIDPRALVAALSAARQGGAGDVIGHYHSHPGAAARPSATDHAHAFYPDHAWLIVAVQAPDDGAAQATEVTAWRPDPTAEEAAFRLHPLTLNIRTPA